MITADEVAVVIVAACRETREDPVACATGSEKSVRARHYAMHALAEVHPPRAGTPVDRALIARLCGVRWDPRQQRNYFSASVSQVIGPFISPRYPERNVPHWARWFDDAAYARVRAALAVARLRAGLLSDRFPTAAAPLPAVVEARASRTRVLDTFALRRAPARDYADHTAELMGDPPPGRSALDDRADRERARALSLADQEREEGARIAAHARDNPDIDEDE